MCLSKSYEPPGPLGEQVLQICTIFICEFQMFRTWFLMCITYWGVRASATPTPKPWSAASDSGRGSMEWVPKPALLSSNQGTSPFLLSSRCRWSVGGRSFQALARLTAGAPSPPKAPMGNLWLKTSFTAFGCGTVLRGSAQG